MKRRGAGEGSVYQRKDGLWCAVVSLGSKASGGRRRKVVANKSKAEVLKQLVKLQADPAKATARVEKILVETILDVWMRDVVEVDLRLTTARQYRGIVKNHLKPAIGKVVAAKLTAAHVQHLLAEQSRAKKGGRTRQLSLVVLRLALDNAVKLKQVASNVARELGNPTHVSKDIAFHEAKEAQAVIAKAKVTEPRFAPLYVLAYDTGARWGELAGSQWSDFDLRDVKNAKWHVQHNLVETERRQKDRDPNDQREKDDPEALENALILTKTPKTKHGNRIIDISQACAEALVKHRAAMGTIAGYAFTTSDEGKPLRLSNFTRRVHDPLLTAAKVKRVSPHGLRHTHATLLLAAGVDLKVVSQRLGHKDVMTTLRIYQHVMPSQQKDAAIAIGKILKG